MDEYLLPHPKLDISAARFGIIFERPDLQKISIEQRVERYKEGVGRLGERLGEKLGENQQKIVEIMENNRDITKPELSDKLKISTTAVENNLAKLKEKGIIKRISPSKGGHWEVSRN